MTEDAFLVAKIEREKRHKEREKDKKHHKSHKSSRHKDHHKSDRKDRDRDRHRDRKDRDKEKRSSNDDNKKKSSSPKEDSNFPAKKIENKEPEVRPEDIEKKVEEILASSGALEVAKSREISQQQQIQNKQDLDDEVEVLQDDVNEPGEIDIPAFTQALQNEPGLPGSPDPEVLKESEVTSTVSIKTPEETLIGSTNPSVWNGEIGKDGNAPKL